MAAQANLKAAAITSLDATPPVRTTAGKGGVARMLVNTGSTAALTTAGTSGGILRMVRVPSNAIIKRVAWAVDASVTTFDADIGVYYSDKADGTTMSNVANANTAIDASFFANAVDMHTVQIGWTDITFKKVGAGYLPSKSNKELWDALALSSDPEGFFDICMTNTSTTSGAPVPSLLVEYALPGD